MFCIDFIKQVVENGNKFDKSHYFMMLMQLNIEEIQEPAVIQTIQIITEELEVTEFEYVQFNQGIKDNALQRAFFEIRTKIFNEE